MSAMTEALRRLRNAIVARPDPPANLSISDQNLRRLKQAVKVAKSTGRGAYATGNFVEDLVIGTNGQERER